jgi:UDP-3-O-[3-hydroxymyristoyl] glucosamine N-acyltransferase
MIHPHSWIADNVSIGQGCVIYPGVTIYVDVVIGDFVTINMNSSIGHNAVISAYTTLAPNVGIGGNVKLHNGCNIGIGTSVIFPTILPSLVFPQNRLNLIIRNSKIYGLFFQGG